MATDPKIRYDILANAQGGQEVERLADELERLDGSIDPELGRRAQALASELRTLGQQDAAIQQFAQLKRETEAARDQLAQAQQAAQALGRELADAGTPTKAQAGQMQKLADAVREAKQEVQAKARLLDGARAELTQYGLASERVATAERETRAAMAAAGVEAARLGQQHQALAQEQEAASTRAAAAAEEYVDQLQALVAAEEEQARAAQAAADQRDQDAQSLRSVESAATRAASSLIQAGGSSRVFAEAMAEQRDAVRPVLDQLDRLADSIDPAVAQRARDLALELRNLGAQRAAIEQFQELGASTTRARSAMEAADAAVEAFSAEIAGLQAPTREEAAELDRLTERARQARIAFLQQSDAQQQAAAALRGAGVEVDKLTHGQAQLNTQTTATARAARQVVEAYAAQGAAARQSADQQATSHRRIRDGVDSISQQLDRLQRFSIGAVLGNEFVQVGRSVAETADQYANLAARVRLVTGEGAAFTQAMEGIYEVARRTGSALESTGELFTRIATAGREIGLSQRDALALTESINQAVQISGASAAASDAALTQLIQGLQSGVLRGEEFNSVMEQAPRLAAALAAGLGVTRGELRAMAEDGQLSTETVIRALRSQAEVLRTEFAQMPQTVGRAIQNLQTEWLRFVGTLDQSSGSTTAIAAGINLLAENLDTVARLAGVAGAALTAGLATKGAAALRAYVVEATAATGATNLLTAAINKVPAVITITVAAVGFEIGYQIGQQLYENSELARKLGIGITAFFQNLVNDLQLVAEAAAAVFTDDTIGQAFDRYRERGKELDQIFSDMWKGAEKAPSAIAAAAKEAQKSAEQLGEKGQQAATLIAKGSEGAAKGVSGVGQAASESEAAITALAKAAGIKLPEVAKTATAQAAAMADLAVKSGEAAKRIGKEIPEAIAKLSGPELLRFRDTFVTALKQAGDQSQLLQTVLVETGKRAAEALGVDVVAASRTVSKEFSAAADNISLVVRSIDALKAAGVDTGRVLSEALSKMIEGARNQAELDALKNRIEALGKAGQISKVQLADLFDSMRTKADELKKGVNSVAEALKVFGIQSQAELKKVADNFKQAWDRIKNDSSITLADKQNAFKQYAEAAIAANKGVVTSELQVEAGMVKMRIAADAAGKAVVEAMGAARPSLDAVGMAAEEAARQLRQMQQEQEAATAAAAESVRRAQAVAESATGTGGGTRTAKGSATLQDIIKELKGYGLDDATAQRIAADFVDPSTGRLPDFGRSAGHRRYATSEYDTWSVALQRAAQEALGARSLAGQGGSSSTDTGGLRTTPPGRVVIELGGKPTTINTATVADQQALMGLFRELESASGVAVR